MKGKYAHVINIGLQNQLVYRANFFFRAAFGLVPLLATIYLWKTIYAGKGDESLVAGYGLSQMISYYLIVTIVDGLTAVNDDDWLIAADIKDGAISQFLLKPINYLGYRLCLFGCGRIVYMAIAVIPVSVFIFCWRRHFEFPETPQLWILFFLSTILAAMLQFLISFTMALLAFWVLEVSTFIFILFAFEYIASGQLFPLDILPEGLLRVMEWTPFYYELFFPVSVWLGRFDIQEIYAGLAIQGLWVCAAYVMARWMWSRGVRQYSAVGG